MSAECRLLVFDWDGTLVDSEARIVDAASTAIAEIGLPARARAEIRDIIGLGLHEAVEKLYPDADEATCVRFVEHYRRHFVQRMGAGSPLFPGVAETLEALRGQAYALAVATGKSRAGLARELEATGLGEHFDATRCADETCSKPHPRMLFEIMEELGFERHETLMVGDTVYDLEMARNAGVRAAAVTCGVHERDRLLQFEPLVFLESVAGLPPWLTRLRRTPQGQRDVRA